MPSTYGFSLVFKVPQSKGLSISTTVHALQQENTCWISACCSATRSGQW